MPSVLIVDDEPHIASALGAFFERGGHEVFRAHTGDEAIQVVQRERPDLVLLDVRLPDMTGFDVLERVRDGRSLVVMITGHGDVPLAVRAMQSGAENFLTKPVELAHLGAVAERVFEKVRLRQMNEYLSDRRGREASTVLGSSPQMRELGAQIDLLARSDRTTVLLVGETGTGKGRVAAAIHDHSPRAARPFVEVNCAALTSANLDVELFGQERVPGQPGNGESHSPGVLELAHEGTLFLDEIGDLDAHLQPKLLRVLEGKGFRRLGGSREVASDVRLVAATTHDLVQEVTAGRFREDLYYRLSVMPIHLPPLRARARDDLIELVARVLGELAAGLPDSPAELEDAALDRLLKYAWPGNIRELRNVLERAMILARGGSIIHERHLPAEVRDASGLGVEHHVPRTLEEVERAHIDRTLRAHAGNRTRAAKELGISRATLIKKIKEFGLRSR